MSTHETHERTGMFRAEMRRTFLSPAFWVAFVLILLVNLATLAEEYNIQRQMGQGSVVYLFANYVMMDVGIVVVSLGVLPSGLSFCADWKHQFIRYSLIRTTPARYGWTKVAVTAIGAFLAVFCAGLLTVALLSITLPALDLPAEVYAGGENPYQLGPVGAVALSSPIGYYLLQSTIYALNCASWAVFALLVSAYQPNPLVTLAAPLIVYYTLVILLPLPSVLNPWILMHANVPFTSWQGVLLFTLSVNLVLLIGMGYLFCRKVMRRLSGATMIDGVHSHA